jgi:RNA polymerase sigma factor (sigma-70 family)
MKQPRSVGRANVGTNRPSRLVYEPVDLPSRSPAESEAFFRFYTAHWKTVLRLLTKIGVRTADLPDLAQLVFLKVHKNFEQVPEEGINGWLEMICRQQAAELYRLHRHRFETPEPNVGLEVAGEDDPHARLERHQLDEMVKQILQSMSPKLTAVLVRHEFNSESLETIAEALGISRNTAQRQLAQAKELFRRKAESRFGRGRGRLLVLPFGLDTAVPTDSAFVDRVGAEVWRGLSRELGFGNTSAPADALDPSPASEAPSSGKRLVKPRGTGRTIREVVTSALVLVAKHPLFLLGVGGVLGGGIATAALWPYRDKSPIKHHAAPLEPSLIVGNIEPGETTTHTLSPSPPATIPSAPVVKAPRPAPKVTPFNDPEMTILEHALELLAQGKYREALDVLHQHEREYPDSQLAGTRERYRNVAFEEMHDAGSP